MRCSGKCMAARAQARRQRRRLHAVGLEPLGAGAQHRAGTAFLEGDRAARRARVEMTLHLGALLSGQRAVGVLREEITDATTVRLHVLLPATLSLTAVSLTAVSLTAVSPRAAATGVDAESFS